MDCSEPFADANIRSQCRLCSIENLLRFSIVFRCVDRFWVILVENVCQRFYYEDFFVRSNVLPRVTLMFVLLLVFFLFGCCCHLFGCLSPQTRSELFLIQFGNELIFLSGWLDVVKRCWSLTKTSYDVPVSHVWIKRTNERPLKKFPNLLRLPTRPTRSFCVGFFLLSLYTALHVVVVAVLVMYSTNFCFYASVFLQDVYPLSTQCFRHSGLMFYFFPHKSILGVVNFVTKHKAKHCIIFQSLIRVMIHT